MFVEAESKQYSGLISGGCFERDVVAHCLSMAKTSAENKAVQYDLGSDEDILFGTGVGCPGTVDLVIERVTKSLMKILDAIFDIDRSHTEYWTVEKEGSNSNFVLTHTLQKGVFKNDGNSLVREVQPLRKLIIIGAGEIVNALSEMASFLGVEHEIWVGQNSNFEMQHSKVKVLSYEDGLKSDFFLNHSEKIDFALLSHNLNLDCQVLEELADMKCSYIGMMGSKKRLNMVEERLGSEVFSKVQPRLFSPIGLNLGGRDSKSIALSICAEIQKCRFDQRGKIEK